MGSPIIWFGAAAKLLKSRLTIPGSTSGTLSIEPAAATTTHVLTMPAAQGASGEVLTNNGSGVLSWGSPTATTYGVVIDNASNGNITVVTGTSRFVPYLSLTSPDVYTVQTGAQLVSVDTLTVSVGATLTVNAGGEVKIL